MQDALRWAIRLFVLHQADTPRLDAELLLAYVLGVERPHLIIRRDECLSPEQVTRFTHLVRRALDDAPIAYLLGERAFYDVTLRVTPDVLIPRPETEHMVEEALSWAAGCPGPLRIVDVGTGSGALAIVLARHLPDAQVYATDISRAALGVAAENVARYGLQGRVRLVQSDLLGALAGVWDIIVANLPYIDPLAMPALQASVLKHEPHMALEGGAQGVAIITRLIEQLPSRLARPGIALLECDPQQVPSLVATSRSMLPEARVTVVKDLAGLDRLIRIERRSP